MYPESTPRLGFGQSPVGPIADFPKTHSRQRKRALPHVKMVCLDRACFRQQSPSKIMKPPQAANHPQIIDDPAATSSTTISPARKTDFRNEKSTDCSL